MCAFIFSQPPCFLKFIDWLTQTTISYVNLFLLRNKNVHVKLYWYIIIHIIMIRIAICMVSKISLHDFRQNGVQRNSAPGVESEYLEEQIGNWYGRTNVYWDRNILMKYAPHIHWYAVKQTFPIFLTCVFRFWADPLVSLYIMTLHP